MRAHSRTSALTLVIAAVLVWSAPVRPLAGGQAAQQQPADAAQPEPERSQTPIRSGINFVRVDVIVTDGKGEPVLDLKPEDFTITENGRPQTVETFTTVKIDAVSQTENRPTTTIRTDFDEQREASRDDVRLFVILLDDYHVRRGNDLAVRKPLIEFIHNQLDPADMVAIMYPLTSINDIRFTRNRNETISVIESFLGRKFDYTPRNAFEEQYAYYPAQVVERVRNQVTMGALKAAAVRLGGLREGRKSIIFVSEGFTTTLPPQLNDPVAAMPGFRNPVARRNTPTADQIDERVNFSNLTDLMSDLRDVFDVANRQNASIYPVDPRGLAAMEYGINEGVGLNVDRQGLAASLDSLRMLASNTDGRAIINRNDLATGMQQIIRDASAYYLLGYSSTVAPTDGKFHEIRVRVNRRGVDVRARKGYWAVTAEEAARASAPPRPGPPPAVAAALNEIAEPERGRPARFWVGTQRADGGHTRVTFTWDPIAPPPGVQVSARERPARIALTATTESGDELFRGRVPSEASENGSADDRTVSFDAPPGPLQLRVVIEGAEGQIVDSVNRDVTLPDFTRPEVAFATPRVFRGRTPRDLADARANLNAVPTTEREFSRVERLFVRAQVYTPGQETPQMSASLLNRGGQKMADLPVQLKDGGIGELELPLSALPMGDYLIELSAKAGEGAAQEMIAFKVGR